jgi:hypothetical protein
VKIGRWFNAARREVKRRRWPIIRESRTESNPIG